MFNKPIISKLQRYKAYSAYQLDIEINRFYLRNYIPILIWQMGKVGSTSIYQSLKKARIHPIFSFHSLEYPGSRFSPNFGQAPIFIYERITQKLPVKIITLVREPIGRNISSFFQRFQRYVGLQWYQAQQLSTTDLYLLYMNQFRHQEPLLWFDYNFKKYLGLDIYDYDFPKETGYSTINYNNAEILNIKAELDNSKKEEIIAHFLNLNSFQIVNQNTSDNKVYSQAYNSFIKQVKLPESYLEMMKKSQYFNHFYTEKEIDAVILRWTNKK